MREHESERSDTGPVGRQVFFVGAVRPSACGVRAYGVLLAAALRTKGWTVIEQWVPADTTKLRSALGVVKQFILLGWRVPRNSTVVWHYSSYSHAFRGFSSPSILLAPLCALRRVTLVSILHEPSAEPIGVQKAWYRLQVLSQKGALRVIAKSSNSLVVTTDRRAAMVKDRTGVVCHVAPVFSNLPLDLVPSAVSDKTPGRRRIGIFGFGAPNARPELVLKGIRPLLNGTNIEILMVGAPGPTSGAADLWRDSARALGMSEALSFTGILPVEEVARHLSACDLVVLPYDEGPNGRKGTLSGVLGLGCAVLALDGPERWEKVIDAGAVFVARAEVAEITAALDELLRDEILRQGLQVRSKEFYRRWLAIDVTAQTVADLL